jgi:hypothetical protein
VIFIKVTIFSESSYRPVIEDRIGLGGLIYCDNGEGFVISKCVLSADKGFHAINRAELDFAIYLCNRCKEFANAELLLVTDNVYILESYDIRYKRVHYTSKLVPGGYSMFYIAHLLAYYAADTSCDIEKSFSFSLNPNVARYQLCDFVENIICSGAKNGIFI